MTFFLHVVHSAAIAFLEAAAVVVAKLALYPRMTIPFMIIRILVAACFKIVACGLNAVVEALSLRVAIFRRRLIPSAFLVGRG